MGYIAGKPYRFLAGHETRYRRAQTIEQRLWSRIERGSDDACWLWTGAHTPAGYGVIGYLGKQTTAHRLVYSLTYGPIPQNQIVCHSCDNPRCCNPKHLWLGSDKTNSDDKIVKGREGHPDNHGTRNPHARLTAEDVVTIRQVYGDGHSLRQLANEYGVNPPAIWKIVTRRTWKHI